MSRASRSFFKKIKESLPSDQVLTGEEDRLCYSYDATGKIFLPDFVVKAKSVENISAVLKAANEVGVPVIPRGSGSGFAGGTSPIHGGVVLALAEMNRILEIDQDNMIATVEPGVITGVLQTKVETLGLFYPPDPSSLKISTIGGNAATCAGGPRAVKYGVTKQYILGAEIVLPDGEILQSGGKLTKNVAGYDLTSLFVGSEGTLGVMSKLLLKLLPKPGYVLTLFALFPSIEDASEAVSDIISSKVIPSTLEFMDRETLSCVKENMGEFYSKTAGAALLIEVDGESKSSISYQKESVVKILNRHHVEFINSAHEKEKRESLWSVRRSISPALGKLKPTKINQDIGVPRSKIPEMINILKNISLKHRLLIVNFGHAGDGNIHVNIMTDRNDESEFSRVGPAVSEIFDSAISLGGTISGEHGIGVSKKAYLERQVGTNGIRVMREIKRALDPKNIMNPGKIFS